MAFSRSTSSEIFIKTSLASGAMSWMISATAVPWVVVASSPVPVKCSAMALRGSSPPGLGRAQPRKPQVDHGDRRPLAAQPSDVQVGCPAEGDPFA